MLTWIGVVLLLAGAVAAFVKGVKKDQPWGKPVLGTCALGVPLAFLGVLFYYLIVVLLAAVVIAYVKGVKKEKEWGRSVIAVCTIVIVILVAGNALIGGPSGPTRGQIRKAVAQDLQYARAEMVYLGRHIAKSYPDSKILLITPPASWGLAPQRSEHVLNCLKEGLDERGLVAASEQMPAPVPSATSMPLPADQMALSVEFLDGVMAKHPECNVILSLVNLPLAFKETKLAAMPAEERPAVILALDMPQPDVAEHIRSGRVAALVTMKHVVTYGRQEDAPRDVEQAFKKRYVLITAGNLSEMP